MDTNLGEATLFSDLGVNSFKKEFATSVANSFLNE